MGITSRCSRLCEEGGCAWLSIKEPPKLSQLLSLPHAASLSSLCICHGLAVTPPLRAIPRLRPRPTTHAYAAVADLTGITNTLVGDIRAPPSLLNLPNQNSRLQELPDGINTLLGGNADLRAQVEEQQATINTLTQHQAPAQ